MKKVDTIRLRLDQGVTPKDIAREVPCSLSLVYAVRGHREIALLQHQMAEVRLELTEICERLARLEGSPADIIERMLDRDHNG